MEPSQRSGELPVPSSVDLGKSLEKIVDDLVRRGRYNSRSEVLRAGVRLLHEREIRVAEFDAMIAAGVADLDAGRAEDMDTVLARLQSKLAARTSGKSARGRSSSRPRR
jgi:antitoxin ParD1/3/4